MRDDAKQAARALEAMAGGFWVSHVVLSEPVWVLSKVYGMEKEQIVTAVEMLVDNQDVALEDQLVTRAVLDRFSKKSSPGFFDCLILEVGLKAGYPLVTFDKELAKQDGVERL